MMMMMMTLTINFVIKLSSTTQLYLTQLKSIQYFSLAIDYQNYYQTAHARVRITLYLQ